MELFDLFGKAQSPVDISSALKSELSKSRQYNAVLLHELEEQKKVLFDVMQRNEELSYELREKKAKLTDLMCCTNDVNDTEDEPEVADESSDIADELVALQKAKAAFEEEKAQFEEERHKVFCSTASNAAISQRQELKDGVEGLGSAVRSAMSDLQSAAELFREQAIKTRDMISARLYIDGFTELAQLRRQYSNDPYLSKSLARILCSFGCECIEPKRGEMLNHDESVPYTDDFGSVVTQCISCGWKFGDSVILKAVVESEEDQ